VALSLLVPGALALGALVLLPLIAHMARQTPRERRPFGAMLLLERVVKRLRRRRRVKDWFLLLLRILALVAVVIGAAGLRWSYSGGVPEFGEAIRIPPQLRVERHVELGHDRLVLRPVLPVP